MNTPRQLFAVQEQLNSWTRARKIAGWGTMLLALVCVADVTIALTGRDGIGAPSPAPLFLAATCLIFQAQAARKIRAINQEAGTNASARR